METLRRLGRPRDEARETAILEAALTLISEVGYDRVTMDGIASLAHSSKATIYRRWPSKGALVATAVRCRTGAHPATPDTGSLRGDLMALLEVMAQQMNENDLGLLTGIFAAMRSDPDLAAAIREQMFTEKAELVAPMFTRATARGEHLRPDAGQLFLEIAPSMVIHRLMVDNEPVDTLYITHVVDDVLLPVFSQPTPRNAPNLQTSPHLQTSSHPQNRKELPS